MKVPKLLPAALAIGFFLGLAAGPAAGQSGTDRRATDIIRSLAPTAPSSIATTQSSKPRKPVSVRGVTSRTKRVDVIIDRAYALDFDVYFGFDSATLDRTARQSLAELGRALSSTELADYSFLIAGHTDAKGSDAYNLELSTRRARAVRAYLLEAFAIAPDRLFTFGFGESDLKDPRNPTAGINRRVEVALIVEEY